MKKKLSILLVLLTLILSGCNRSYAEVKNEKEINCSISELFTDEHKHFTGVAGKGGHWVTETYYWVSVEDDYDTKCRFRTDKNLWDHLVTDDEIIITVKDIFYPLSGTITKFYLDNTELYNVTVFEKNQTTYIY